YVPEGEALERAGQHCYREIRISGLVTVTPWDGTTGGTLILSATHGITVGDTGTIDARGAGERGGLPSPEAARGGFDGEGPGRGCGGGDGGAVAQAGSGAGYGGAGGIPGNPYTLQTCPVCSQATLDNCAGPIGQPYGTSDGSDVAIGSGGGAAGNSSGCANAGGPGGAGGGAVVLASGTQIVVDGSILAAGAQPPPDLTACGYRAGGGGGSGGSIALASPSVAVGESALLDASGGQGGEGMGFYVGTPSWAWGGGGGGGGRV